MRVRFVIFLASFVGRCFCIEDGVWARVEVGQEESNLALNLCGEVQLKI